MISLSCFTYVQLTECITYAGIVEGRKAEFLTLIKACITMLPPLPPNHPSVSLSFFSSYYFFLLFHSLPTGCGARSASLWVHRNLFWQLSRDGNLHGSNMLHVTIADQKPSFGTLRRMSDAVVGRGNACLTTSKSGRPCPCQSSSQGPPAEKTGRRSSAELSLMSPWQPRQSRNWAELNFD